MNKKSTYLKTEEVLKNYNSYKLAIKFNMTSTVRTKKLIKLIDDALKTIEGDYYYSIIEMIFFEHKTREAIAEIYNVDVKTIIRNKTRLINKLKVILFSDESIEELFTK